MHTTATIASARASSTVVASAASHTGMVRAVNEDSHLAIGPVFLVADGMGGHNAGDKASQAVRATFTSAFATDAPATTATVLAAIRASNDAVRAISDDDGARRSISGTTLAGVALVASGDTGLLQWMVFNIGDSRIYSWHGRSLAQVSVDHSAVQELVDSGAITSEEAALRPDRNVITRAIGASDHVDADVWLLPAGRIQSFLLCSDGLTKELTDEQIAQILADSEGDVNAADALVQAALDAGGRDNVTVVVVTADTTGPDADGDDDLDDLEDTRPRA